LFCDLDIIGHGIQHYKWLLTARVDFSWHTQSIPQRKDAASMAGIFINYRTADGPYVPEVIYAHFAELFGNEQVFLDATELEPGRSFHPELTRRLELTTVLITLIGARWLTLTDDSGTRLLDRTNDYVRWEIETSLKRKIHVMPVLLEGTPLPRANELPRSIAALASHQYLEIRPRHLPSDLKLLAEACERHVPVRHPKAPRPSADDANGIRTGNVDIRDSAVAFGHGSRASNQWAGRSWDGGEENDGDAG
jgi:hypothetical protein